MHEPSSHPLPAMALMVGAAFAYATLPVFAKLAYEHGADAAGILVVRFAVVAPVVTAIAVRRRSCAALRTLPAGRLAALAAVFFVQTWTFFLSLEHMAAVLAVLLLFLYPILVWGGAAVVLGEPLTRSGAAVALCGTAGVALSVGISGRATPSGVAFGLLSAVCFTVYVLGAKRLMSSGTDALALTAAVYSGTALAYLTLALWRGASFPPDAGGWLSIAATTLIGTLTAGVLFVVALDRLPAGPASMVSAAEPAMSVGLAAAVLGEPVSAAQIAGMVLLCSAIGYLGLELVRPRSRPTAPAPDQSPA